MVIYKLERDLEELMKCAAAKPFGSKGWQSNIQKEKPPDRWSCPSHGVCEK